MLFTPNQTELFYWSMSTRLRFSIGWRPGRQSMLVDAVNILFTSMSTCVIHAWNKKVKIVILLHKIECILQLKIYKTYVKCVIELCEFLTRTLIYQVLSLCIAFIRNLLKGPFKRIIQKEPSNLTPPPHFTPLTKHALPIFIWLDFCMPPYRRLISTLVNLTQALGSCNCRHSQL